MGREFHVLSKLHPAYPTPKPLLHCADESVIGAPFYVMERIEGDVMTAAVPPSLHGEETRIGEELIDALVEVHAVDWRACGLEGYGKPTGYLDRQLRRFGGLWEHNKTREIATLDRITAWLAANRPESGPATIVHGDYRLGNVMYAPGAPARLVAIFDWELATIGDPLADVGLLMVYWPDRGEAGEEPIALGQPANLAPGFPSRAELRKRYAESSGRDLSQLDFYVALGYWKLAIILEGVYARYAAGQYGKVDPGIEHFARLVERLAEAAEAAERRS
jgi:aminoglycoside phosphotransferase (APT) family kinase protein